MAGLRALATPPRRAARLRGSSCFDSHLLETTIHLAVLAGTAAPQARRPPCRSVASAVPASLPWRAARLRGCSCFDSRLQETTVRLAAPARTAAPRARRPPCGSVASAVPRSLPRGRSDLARSGDAAAEGRAPARLFLLRLALTANHRPSGRAGRNSSAAGATPSVRVRRQRSASVIAARPFGPDMAGLHALATPPWRAARLRGRSCFDSHLQQTTIHLALLARTAAPQARRPPCGSVASAVPRSLPRGHSDLTWLDCTLWRRRRRSTSGL
jgi:hypothetical protein